MDMQRMIPMLEQPWLVKGKERCESRSCLRSERVTLHGRELDKGRFTACISSQLLIILLAMHRRSIAAALLPLCYNSLLLGAAGGFFGIRVGECYAPTTVPE